MIHTFNASPLTDDLDEAAPMDKQINEHLIARLKDVEEILITCDWLDRANAVAQALERIASLEAELAKAQASVPRWISCADGLPPLDMPVLAMSSVWPGQMFSVMRVDGGEGWLWAVSSGYHQRLNTSGAYEVDDDYEFSCWQPLPQTPTPLP